MNKNIEKSNRHSEVLTKGSFKRFFGCCPQNDVVEQSGQTLFESLMTLSIIGILTVFAMKGYNMIVTNLKVHNTAKMIKTLALERQNSAIKDLASKRTIKGPHSSLHMENGTAGHYSKYFWVETTLSDKDFCNKLKKSELIQADLIEIDGIVDGNCENNSKLSFYFKKDALGNETLTWVDETGNIQKCPVGSAACDSEGNATVCEEGYYLEMGFCEKCGKHVATCENEETPLACEEGYALLLVKCIQPPQMCTTDTQCSVCGECDTETGYCQNECSVPTNRCYKDSDCGMNECIICDTDTHSCQHICERKEYLETINQQTDSNSTNDASYIDTGIIPTDSTKIECKMQFTTLISGQNKEALNGSTGSSGKPRFAWGFAAVSPYTNFYFGLGAQNLTTSVTRDTNVHTFVLDATDKTCSIDGTTNNFTTSGSLSNTRSIYLFARHGEVNYANKPSNAKVYYCKIWDDNKLVRDFIPVSSPKGNCMFDRVNEKLFCNAATGEFETN